MELKMPGTDLHAELLKTKRKSKAKWALVIGDVMGKREIKMMAPSSLFQLENYDDPLMFASLGNDYFYLIHKWGNDLSFFRKIMMWPFKSLYNIIIFMCIISLFLTLIIPKDLFQYENNPGAEFFITYLFILKSVIAIFIYYGFALGKNFNEYIWNRKFYN